jgi:GrxC family glutaredoxin
MAQIEIYTTRYCPYCLSAKALLTRKGVTFTEIDVTGDWEGRRKMVERAKGHYTVPQIFIGTTHVGGSDELHELDHAGKLDPLLAAAEGQIGMTSQGSTFNVALVQLRSGLTPAPNLDMACKLIAEAKTAGADYVQTPEMTNILALKRELLFAAIVPEEQDASLATFRELARKLAIHLHVGSLALKISPDKAANRSFLINPSGDIVARYDKIHMFDVDLAGGESYRESRNYRPGEIAVVTDLPWGRLGLSICYDLRFPALYRALAEAGSSFIAIPAAFTKQTGEAHWHVLMRARAIENGCFVFAAAQGGRHENGRDTFGHSLIVDPWGRILAEGETEPGIVMAKIDPAEVAKARARIPSLQHGRRFELVQPMAEPTPLHAAGGER